MGEHIQDNPYSALLTTLRRDSDERTASAWCLGIVESVAPLAVRTGGITLSGGDLLCNCQLLANIEQVKLAKVSGELSGTVDCTKGSITKLTASTGTLTASGLFGGVLAVGDTVAMLRSSDAQQFVILCKVVGG